MRRVYAVVVLLVLAVPVAAFLVVQPHGGAGEPLQSGAVPSLSGSRADLIIHEWGTFTSVSGSDGVLLSFRPLTRNDLPSFVFSLADVHGRAVFRKYALSAFQRMETPVTYFYTPFERDVRVRVEFPEGLLTEFYPPPRTLVPSPNTAGDSALTGFGSIDPERVPIGNSQLDWGRLHLIPQERLAAQVRDPDLASRIGRFVEQTMVPDTQRDNHYGFARNTDSAMVQLSMNKTELTVPAADYFEKFLFYRGIGNFASAVQMTASVNGRFTITNSISDTIQTLFLVDVEQNRLRFRTIDSLDGGKSLDTTLPPDGSSIKQLSDAVVSALVQAGLYEKEARAMVDTWSSDWFDESGTRLLYLLPQAITDGLLPLHVVPEPDETVRVMVGRLELMTPEREHDTEQLLLSRLTEDAVPAAGAGSQEGDEQFLETLGRWAEPALVRVQTTTADERIRKESGRLLEQLRRRPEFEGDRLVQ